MLDFIVHRKWKAFSAQMTPEGFGGSLVFSEKTQFCENPIWKWSVYAKFLVAGSFLFSSSLVTVSFIIHKKKRFRKGVIGD